MTEIERAKSALEYFFSPLVSNFESIQFNVIEGNAVAIIEVLVHQADFDYLNDGENSLFLALQKLISVSCKERKISLELLKHETESV